MARIKPFKALRYNPEIVGDLSKVMAPPYDVISPNLQNELYERHPNNIIRLILGKGLAQDAAPENRYAKAAEYLKNWQKEGALKENGKPSIYYYTQTYASRDGSQGTRKGFIARVKLEEFGGSGSIHPHEKTLSGPKADRLNLMKACSANFSCIFSLYPEGEEVSAEERITDILDAAKGRQDPDSLLVDVKDDDGIINKLWNITDPEVIEKVVELMQDKELFIADGHHRYETALNYRNHMRASVSNGTGEEPFNYVMMYFASMDDGGLEIFPTHRVVHGLAGFDTEVFLKNCGEYFDIEEFPFDEEGEAPARKKFLERLGKDFRAKTRLGLYAKGRNTYYILTLKTPEIMDTVFGESLADVYKSLDVTVLHSLILDKVLGISPQAQEKQENLVYIKGTDEALRIGAAGNNQLTFLMNPTRVEDVRNICKAGLLMPQKSTYFYPKLLSGLVINPLWS